MTQITVTVIVFSVYSLPQQLLFSQDVSVRIPRNLWNNRGSALPCKEGKPKKSG